MLWGAQSLPYRGAGELSELQTSKGGWEHVREKLPRECDLGPAEGTVTGDDVTGNEELGTGVV